MLGDPHAFNNKLPQFRTGGGFSLTPPTPRERPAHDMLPPPAPATTTPRFLTDLLSRTGEKQPSASAALPYKLPLGKGDSLMPQAPPPPPRPDIKQCHQRAQQPRAPTPRADASLDIKWTPGGAWQRSCGTERRARTARRGCDALRSPSAVLRESKLPQRAWQSARAIIRDARVLQLGARRRQRRHHWRRRRRRRRYAGPSTGTLGVPRPTPTRCRCPRRRQRATRAARPSCPWVAMPGTRPPPRLGATSAHSIRGSSMAAVARS